MSSLRSLMIFILLVPVLGFAQLKKDAGKINISNTLETGSIQNSLFGFLDPAKFHMQHGFSVSYAAMGAGGVMMNSYTNMIDYKFSDQLSVRTVLGIMNSPYNTLPGASYLNNAQFFGGAEVRYNPTDDTSVMLRIESVPSGYYYQRGFYGGYQSYFRPSLFDQ